MGSVLIAARYSFSDRMPRISFKASRFGSTSAFKPRPIILRLMRLLSAIKRSFFRSPETSCQGLFIKKISNSIICCTMLVVYVIWLYN